MSATIILHPAQFRHPGSTRRLLAWAANLGLELVASRRGNVLLVPRIK